MTTFSELLSNIAVERHDSMSQLRDTISDSIPSGFVENITASGIEYHVPHQLYADGYHCDPSAPLPFINIVSQKNFIAFHHLGMYSDPTLRAWFIAEYAKSCVFKLDMGKSCVRFKKMTDIPYPLIAKLVQKMSVTRWISIYVAAVKR